MKQVSRQLSVNRCKQQVFKPQACSRRTATLWATS